jgi:hypothetical protein
VILFASLVFIIVWASFSNQYSERSPKRFSSVHNLDYEINVDLDSKNSILKRSFNSTLEIYDNTPIDYILNKIDSKIYKNLNVSASKKSCEFELVEVQNFRIPVLTILNQIIRNDSIILNLQVLNYQSDFSNLRVFDENRFIYNISFTKPETMFFENQREYIFERQGKLYVKKRC